MKKYITNIAAAALAEDLFGGGDITTHSLVSSKHRSSAKIIVKTAGTIGGLELAKIVFKQLDKNFTFNACVKEGHSVKAFTVIAQLKGSTRALLTGERTALNFLSYVSGIATKTQQFVSKVKGYKTQILDTRKTTPLLRALERYAVRCGGGVNHRFNLSDMVMIKDNHRVVAKGDCLNLNEAVNQIKAKTTKQIELEVDTLEELAEALLTKADIILLDNMTPTQTKAAVLMRNRLNKRILLESSGGINLNNVAVYAATGVERISIGALTHSRCALDFSLEFEHGPH